MSVLVPDIKPSVPLWKVVSVNTSGGGTHSCFMFHSCTRSGDILACGENVLPCCLLIWDLTLGQGPGARGGWRDRKKRLPGLFPEAEGPVNIPSV